MAENNTKLFSEFPPTTTEEWQNKIVTDLKGADFERKLVWRTNEGFNVRPYYREEDLEEVQYLNTLPGEFPYVRGNHAKGNDWYIRQDTVVTDLAEANKKALDILYKGVNSLAFVFKGDANITVDDLKVLLKDICLEAIELNIVTCNKKVENAKVLAQYITEVYGADAQIVASVNVDPIKNFTRKGAIDESIFADMKTLVDETAGLSKLSVIGVNGKIYLDAGSSIVQELAFSLASGAEYLSQLSELGADVATVARKIKFNLGISGNYFIEIAKLRAARVLWAKIVEAFQPESDCYSCGTSKAKCAGKMLVHSENTIFNKTVYDPYVNLLRTQTEAMSAVLGGADSITVLPFNAIYEESTPFSERIARNQQLLLKEESHFDKIVDPGAGSYYIENLTDSILTEAWKLFLEVQDKGGYIAAFKEGFIQAKIAESSANLDKKIATRRENILGTNQFPNFSEYLEIEFSEEVFGKQGFKADNAIAEPIQTYRGAQAFETLRAATDTYAKDNKRPLAFMITVGNVVMRKARAQFACNFFAVAGFEVKEGKGYKTVEEGVADAKAAGAEIVVICSSDDEYAEFAPAVKALLTDEIFVVAGAPKCTDELKAKGIENFISVRSNLLEELKAYQKQLIK